jgi:transcriptional regulator with XRE-family HTH domain
MSKLDIRKLRRMLTRVLDAATPSLRDLAREARIPYTTVRAYRRGSSGASAPVLRRLAVVLRRRATVLRRAADQLEAVAGRR